MNSIEELAARHCKPRKGEADRLSREAVERELGALPGWHLADDGSAISKRFAFADYYRTMGFVNALAWVAHGEDHHPDLEVGYDKVLVRWSTHDVGGVSENDLICAARAECLAAGAPR